MKFDVRFLLGAALAAGCVPPTGDPITETGNPEMSWFGVTGLSSAPDEVSLGGSARRTAQPGIVLDEAWVVIGDIRFVKQEVCDAAIETEIDVEGPWIVDLVAQPDAVEIPLAADAYCRVRVPLDRADGGLPPGAPARLDDNALVISGTRSDGRAFTIVSRDRQEADVRSPGAPFDIGEAGAALLLAFDVAAWFDGVPIDQAKGDGDILIADDSNEEILELFEERVERSLELFEDDGDHELSDDDTPLADSF